MKGTLKRILSFVLMAAICFSLISFSTLADDELLVDEQIMADSEEVVQIPLEEAVSETDAEETEAVYSEPAYSDPAYAEYEYVMDQQEALTKSPDPIGDAPYNYKKGFDDSEEIVTATSWRAVPDQYVYKIDGNNNKAYIMRDAIDPVTGLPLLDEEGNPVKERTPDLVSERTTSAPKYAIAPGLYGNALAITYYGAFIGPNQDKDRWGAVMDLTIPVSRLLIKDAVGNDKAVYQNFGDAIYGFQRVGFWARAEKVSTEERTMAATRTFSVNIAGYGASVTIQNNQDWQYVILNASDFKKTIDKVVTPLDTFSEEIMYASGINKMQIGIGHSNFFGANPPQCEVPPSDPNYNEKRIEFVDRLYIDEMTFDRSTPERRTTTRPSVGEIDYYRNSKLSQITFNDYVNINNQNSIIPGSNYKLFDKNINGYENMEIRLPYSFDTNSDFDKSKIIAKGESVDIAGDANRQIQSGSVVKINYPATIPYDDNGAMGSIVVTAGSGEKTVYNVKFIREALKPFKIEWHSDNYTSTLTPGNRLVTIRVKNITDTPQDIFALGILEDKQNGALRQFIPVTVKNIAPGATADLNFIRFSLPIDYENIAMKIYFYDNPVNMKTVINPLRINANN